MGLSSRIKVGDKVVLNWKDGSGPSGVVKHVFSIPGFGGLYIVKLNSEFAGHMEVECCDEDLLSVERRIMKVG